MSQLQAEQTMRNNKKEYVNNIHPRKIYKGNKDGKWYTYIPLGDNDRKKVKKNSEDEIYEFLYKYYKEEENNPTIGELFHRWCDERLELGEITSNSYDRYNDVFKRHYTDTADRKIKDISINDWIYFLKKEKVNKTLNKKAVDLLITTIRGITYKAKTEGKLPFNLTDFYDELTITRKKMKFQHVKKEDYQEVFDEEEYSKMLTYLRENLDPTNCAMLLMFVTGLRVGEVVALKNEDIKSEEIIVRRTETKRKNPDGEGHIYSVKDFPKTEDGWRHVVLPVDYQYLLRKIRLLNPFGEYVFLNTKGQRMTTNSIRRRLERLCDKLGIYRKSPHKARKTVGTIYMDEKLDHNFITGQLGWSNIAVGEEHYHRNRKDIDKKVNILSSIKELSV